MVEIVPPYVQTTLMGERQANDPEAMPLDEFMQILQTEGGVKEVCVKRVHPLRFAAEAGQEQYEKFFEQFNDRMHK